MSQYENSTTVAEQRQRILRLEARNSALTADNKTLESEVAALRQQVEALRLFGNKDCTAQADEYLAARAYLGMDTSNSKESSNG